MIIKVRVIPNSKRNDVVSRIGSILRVKIAAPAVEGKANEELCDYLSDFFDVSRSNVLLRKGERGREKTIEITGRTEEELEEVLGTIPWLSEIIDEKRDSKDFILAEQYASFTWSASFTGYGFI